ncbi:pyocin activator PrtN family protein [Moritella viscosa]|uniref:pyocin activator PrtN family protein n=1 Tax=Moritella viscosa TaxID=80854 RepID=UPI0009E56386|nr:pyocin activator PrtN family protein [Moritella viscosa]
MKHVKKENIDKENSITLTHQILLQQFNHRVLIPIDEIAEPYLNLSRRTVLNRAKTHYLPFPCFKIGDSQKSPVVVHLNNLVNYINQSVAEEKSNWQKFQIEN